MEGIDYWLASVEGVMVAGLYLAPTDGGLPGWCLYVAVDDCDASAAAMQADGAGLIVPPADIPGTGRFAVLRDPLGAVFGILHPLPMADGSAAGGAFDQRKAGHGNWHELMSPDPEAALAFYGKHLGWALDSEVDMGPIGRYRIFQRDGAMLGGIMGLPQPGMPSFWLPYFGCERIDAAVAALKARGATRTHGPQEVPGGAWLTQAVDPQGAAFALVGPR